MLKLLRQIRQKLIIQENVQKYLLYAIGEILLVVIGILLALQINIINENRKRVNQEKYLIQELKKELQYNLFLIENDIKKNKEGLNGTLEFLKLIQEGELEQQIDKTDSLIVYLYYINSIDPVSGVINDIISTGKLDLIRDDSLRKELANWVGETVDLHDDVDIRNNYLFNTIIPFVSKNYPLINTKNNYKDTNLNSPLWNEIVDSRNPINLEQMYSNEMEGHLYNHALNQEYVINGTVRYQNYIKSILNRIQNIVKDQN